MADKFKMASRHESARTLSLIFFQTVEKIILGSATGYSKSVSIFKLVNWLK
jgi:hypothetical protein